MFPLNVPNVLTVLRILLVPVLVVALTTETKNGDTIAAIVFALAAITDGLDGYIARSRKSITTFGKVMDPIADKMLIAAALIALVSLERLAAWVAMVIIAREFAVSSLRVAAAAEGAIIPASILGKIKTVIQVVTVMALIVANDPHAAWVEVLVGLMVFSTVVSGVDYFLNVRREIEEARERLHAQRAARSGVDTSRSSSSSREVPRM
ncbi:MAG TPA: CDP-diacylglycerol--glycerol-3-phosphate 3-phosphatidyltransferase [Thermoleophilaceae bacterium]|nr:CDP-diacylglycerol--glycerol-3-phosphate 3-phosphatidyltransferase [Thermoleophilaceae bacterium]